MKTVNAVAGTKRLFYNKRSHGIMSCILDNNEGDKLLQPIKHLGVSHYGHSHIPNDRLLKRALWNNLKG